MSEFPNNHSTWSHREESGVVNGAVNVGVNVGKNVGKQQIIELTERQKVIKDLINGNPLLSAKQMSEVMSVTPRTVERDLSVMQKAGIIRHEGNRRYGIWVVLEPYNKGIE